MARVPHRRLPSADVVEITSSTLVPPSADVGSTVPPPDGVDFLHEEVDARVTHCFIVADCVKRLGLILSFMNGEMVIDTPAKGSVTTSLVHLKSPLSILHRDSVVDLICLPLSILDVILGMNWSEFNYVHINCYNKSVWFSNPDDEKEAEFLSTRKLNELMRDEVHVVALIAFLSIENQTTIDELQVVREFVEVFVDDIPDVPLEKEVEFNVDLIPSTILVSMAPYRMSTSELA
ncbi:uncharacterized protein LOC131651541 [Vicia villosa]|uniref:uncharacterized protein LOC131651541 n=1 Tax=Vicia villosa TaxID=3911 RepID=UPI00273C6E3C|nr:uncharacterized protein LOC131651541 [Vicia villosa]